MVASLYLLILISLSTTTTISPVESHIFIYAACSQPKYTPNTPFEQTLTSFLTSLLPSSSQQPYKSFTLQNEPESTIFGLYQCQGDLKPIDCQKCIETVVNQLNLVCPYSYGASIQLEGCYLRYENFDFLGKVDNNLRYKRCSNKKVGNGDVEFFKRRNDVLGALVSGGLGLGFKVTSSGSVEGIAQCIGDLSSSDDCSSCVSEAVQKLKALCGSAASGEEYLGQCYAKYWASGDYHVSSDQSNDDQAGKSVAIIVGAVACLAIVIVLLSFCRYQSHRRK